jgi:heme-degrading monooxygenase HmoA
LVHVVVYEKVRDHTKWLKTFNGDASNRKGSRGGEILQFENDPNTHYIVFEWSDEEAHDFADFAKTAEMRRVSKEAGVLEQTIQICSPSTIINK